MSGSVDALGEVVASPPADPSDRNGGPPQEPVTDEGTWTAARTLRKFSQVTFAYGVSAAFACASAVIMSLAGSGTQLILVAALLPFLISLVISSYVFTDLLEFLWDGVAGRMVDAQGPSARLWDATLSLLLAGVATLVAGVVLGVLVFGWRDQFGSAEPVAVFLLTFCGIAILLALTLPVLALGPPAGRGIAALGAALGAVALAAEGFLAVIAPMGSDPFLGWMEGTFPLLNWNLGLGALIAASAFLLWESYRFILPAPRSRAVPA